MEEPPFILIRPWQSPSQQEIRNRPLVIKTPSNAYRLPFFADFFSRQRLRLLHLRREAAASINGLYDGWRYPRGFHAFRSAEVQPGPCESAGPHPEPGWWKYDMPPGWQHWKQAPLTQICAFQWAEAHRWIFKEAELCDDQFSLNFEDILNSSARKELDRLISWLNIEADAPLSRGLLSDIPPVMATNRPRRKRYFARAALLEPALRMAEVQEISKRIQ